jgi:hypothetical protein
MVDKIIPGHGDLIRDITAGDGNVANLFYSAIAKVFL